MTLEKIYLVVPCYNEEEIILETAGQLGKIMDDLIRKDKISEESKILFVNDGSKDSTWEKIDSLILSNQIFAGVSLTRNKGHQNALLAGLMVAKNHADAVISLDADLQDDVMVIESFIDAYKSGNDIVYGVRSSRKKDRFFKRFTAELFYKTMRFLGADIVFNHADYRLMSARALEGLSEYDEVNIFLRGIIPQIGYPSTTVSYERKERTAGVSKYPLRKMVAFAFEGITSFSIRPIRFVSVLGGISFLISLIMLIYCIIGYFSGSTVSGWASLGVSIWALGGLQLLAMGVIGEYIGKIYMETKHRPKYIIKQIKGINDV